MRQKRLFLLKSYTSIYVVLSNDGVRNPECPFPVNDPRGGDGRSVLAPV